MASSTCQICTSAPPCSQVGSASVMGGSTGWRNASQSRYVRWLGPSIHDFNIVADGCILLVCLLFYCSRDFASDGCIASMLALDPRPFGSSETSQNRPVSPVRLFSFVERTQVNSLLSGAPNRLGLCNGHSLRHLDLLRDIWRALQPLHHNRSGPFQGFPPAQGCPVRLLYCRMHSP